MSLETKKIGFGNNDSDNPTCIYAEYRDGEIIALWDYLPVCLGKEKPLTKRELACALDDIARQGHDSIVECMFKLQSKREVYPEVDIFFRKHTEEVLKVELSRLSEDKQMSMLKSLSTGCFDGCAVSIKDISFMAETIYGVLSELVL